MDRLHFNFTVANKAIALIKEPHHDAIASFQPFDKLGFVLFTLQFVAKITDKSFRQKPLSLLFAHGNPSHDMGEAAAILQHR